MPIVSSTHSVGPTHQAGDGRHYVTEAHTDGVGEVHRAEYLAAAGTDYVAVRNARALVIAEQLAEAEAKALANDAA